mgnify:CR=1 FL=1
MGQIGTGGINVFGNAWTSDMTHVKAAAIVRSKKYDHVETISNRRSRIETYKKLWELINN